MKTKNLFKVFMLMVFAAFSVGLASCGDDDNNNNEGANSGIIGSWYYNDSENNEALVLTFNSNGKGTNRATDEDGTYNFTFSYSFDGTILVVSGVDEDGENYTDTYTVKFSSDGKTMTLYDGEYTMTLTKK